MTRPAIAGISPSFIVRNVTTAISFYCDMLGFEVEYQQPDADPFFAIVRRDGAMIFVKSVGAEPIPNRKRSAPDCAARWDAYLRVPDPDALRSLRRVARLFLNLSRIRMTACAASRSKMPTGTSCFSAGRAKIQTETLPFPPVPPGPPGVWSVLSSLNRNNRGQNSSRPPTPRPSLAPGTAILPNGISPRPVPM
jgi:catechol 2,3-dioxygenase-like lactoylglutathione lyase family enzyme